MVLERALTLAFAAEIRDPVHGYIRITEIEREIIDSPFLQRLRRIHQLAGSYVVYPGATHTRFEHSIGAMHVAGQIAESLARSSDLKEDDAQELRLAALLHDVGHGPFSHMYEEVLAGKNETSHEDISQLVITRTSIRDALERNGFSPKRMSELAVGRQKGRPPFLNEVIAGGLSADMMDYLPRDSYFTGVEYGKVDAQRVIDSLHVVDGHLVIDDAALYAFEALILARYEMFKAVYFHRTVRAAELMLVRSMKLADSVLGLTHFSNLKGYLELTDEIVLQKLVTLRPSSQGLEEARRLAIGFRDRRLVKCVFEKVVQRKEKAVGKLFADEDARNKVAQDIANAARVGPGEVYLDVPTTPSVPYTYSHEPPTAVGLLKAEGDRHVIRTMPIKDLPLVGSIAGYMDMLRVYTTPENRSAVTRATPKVFADQGVTS